MPKVHGSTWVWLAFSAVCLPVFLLQCLGGCSANKDGSLAEVPADPSVPGMVVDDATVPGREFFLPYMGSFDLNTRVGNDMYLVNAGDFSKTYRVAQGPIEHADAVYARGTSTSGDPVARLYAAVFMQGGRWFRLWLGAGRTHAPEPIGSAGAKTMCWRWLISADIADSDRTLLVYGTPGENGRCFDSDDRAFYLPIDAATDSAPAPFAGIPVGPIHDASGKLSGIVALRGPSLIFMAYPSLKATTLASSLNSPVQQLARSIDGLWLRIGSKLYRVSGAGEISPVRHVTAPGLDILVAPTQDSDYLYFVETSTTSARAPSSIWRVPIDGTTNAEELLELANESIDSIAHTDSRVWFGSSQGNLQKLQWFATAASPPVTSQLADQVNSSVGGIAFYPGRDRLAYNVQDFAHKSLVVKVVLDDGTILLNRTNAQFRGSVDSFPPASWPGPDPIQTYVILVDGGNNVDLTDGTIVGANLVAYRMATVQPVTLKTITSQADYSIYGHGPADLGTQVLRPSNTNRDIFAFDPEQGTYFDVPNPSSLDEQPLY